jgi:hypothetical protein
MLLAVVATVYGCAAFLWFRLWVDPEAFRIVVNRILAHVLEFRLFVDEPRLVLRGQTDLLRENARLLRLLLKPLLATGVIFLLSYGPMDRRFGYRPRGVGEVAVVTLPAGRTLAPSPDFAIETPPVHVPRLNEISWRVRVTQESSRLTKRSLLFGLPWLAWFLIFSTAGAALAAAGCARFLAD